MSTTQDAQELSPRAVVIAMVVFVALLGGGVFAVVKFLTGSPGGSSIVMPTSRRTVTAAVAKADGAPAGGVAAILQRNLFLAPGAKIIPDKIDTAGAPFGEVKPVVPPPPPAAVPQAPKVAYTGSVEIGDATYALLEDLATREAQYTKVGTTVFGCTLIAMTPNVATVQSGGMTFALNLGENKTDEPVAPPKADTPAKPAEGQPAAAPANPPANGGQPNMPNRGDFRGRNRGNGDNGGNGTAGGAAQ